MLIWALVVEKVASLQEIETHWSLDDALRAHAVLEMRLAVDAEQRKMQNVHRKKPAH